MSTFDSLISSLSSSNNYSEKKQIAEYLNNMLRKNTLSTDDRHSMIQYCDSEVAVLPDLIENAPDYKSRDLLFTFEDNLLGLYMQLYPSASDIPEDKMTKIKSLINLVDGYRYLEKYMEALFEQKNIEKNDAEKLITMAADITDEYHKGQLYNGFSHFHDRMDKFTPDARAVIAEYISSEFRRYLEKASLDNDCVNALEVSADVCKYFFNDSIKESLYRILQLGHSNINYYVMETLLDKGCSLPQDTVDSMSKCLTYAEMTYSLLKRYGLEKQFPAEFTSPEYLAKSDMVHWLSYPTELGCEPTEIEYLGKIKYLFKKDIYYVFRFRSDSDTLDDENKNKWLIGWSSQDSGTFSNFDLYDQYAQVTTEKTLQVIKKKLIG